MCIISTKIFYKNTIRHLPLFSTVNDEQYDSPQQEVENEGQPQGMIAHQRMQDEKQGKEGSGSDGSRTEHRLRPSDAHEDAIEDKGRHSS